MNGSAPSAGERDIVAAILDRLAALLIALDEDLDSPGALPSDMEQLNEMSIPRRVAARALLKTVEQMQDQLARLFRLMPKLRLVNDDRWFAQDYANFAEKLGLLTDSFAWTHVIRLRNKLVHDYPVAPTTQLSMLTQAHAATALLREAARRAIEMLGSKDIEQ